jgi:arabinan endo-1,5-alpha-L-arabinosidase
VLGAAVLLAAAACTGTAPTTSQATSTPGATASTTTESSQAPPGTYTNPVFDHDAPDPSVVRAPDGTYYAYTTQSIYLDLLEIPILRSKDLVHWEQVGDAFPTAPRWVLGGAAGDMWAPHIIRWHGRYLLYYSARRLDDGSMAIGLATSATPLGPFEDLGRPLLSRSSKEPAYTAIDPYVLADGGRLFLYWGSDDQPIRVAALSADGRSVIGAHRPLVFPIKRKKGYGGLVEGAWVLRHERFYYLMYSVGDCCSDQANYSVFVARSRSPLGPFVQDPDNPVLQANAKFWATGHNATVTDAAGQDWMLYHARVRDSFSDDRDLMLDRIVWKHGWPVINSGAGPSTTPKTVPRT